MLLNHIQKEHIIYAARYIDNNINVESINKSTYFVKVKDKEYPFKYLVRIAHQQIDGNENEWLDFTSKREYRDHIESLGFKVFDKMKNISFFTQQDILDVLSVAKKKYQKDNPQHIQIANSLKENAWEKTRYWFQLVCAELDDFTGVCEKKWFQRGWDNGKPVSAFKSYTWAKIFREFDSKKEIYFTVGIDAYNKSLVYKLDYQFEHSKYLSAEQKIICDKLIKTSAARWIEISILQLNNYTWDLLIEQTVNFILKYTELYDLVIEEVWEANQKRISRLTYNSNGWIMPSGVYGKSKNSISHEARFGYGHEEWLFDTSKLIDGYHYGFLEPVRKQHQAYEGKYYDVWLYTINGVTKERFFVGEIQDVQVIDKHEASKVKQIYVDNNWMEEMEAQIRASNANNKGFSNWQGIDLFNIKFKPTDLVVNDPIIPISNDNPIINISRYVFSHFDNAYTVEENEDNNFIFITPQGEEEPNKSNSKVEKKKYIRDAKSIEISFYHEQISEKLTNKLREVYGQKNVKREHPAGYGANRIDIVVNTKKGLIFYEIKTYSTLRTSIREAIGQLFEYSYWKNKNKAIELVIVTQPHKDVDKAKTYFAHLRNLFNIPIYYQSFDTQKNELSEKI